MLVASALIAAVVTPVTAGAHRPTEPGFIPARVRVIADQAGVAKGLLGTEDAPTYDAVALRPGRRALAQRIRDRNHLVIGLCDAIIGDGAKISSAERKLHRRHAVAMDGGVEDDLLRTILDESTDVRLRLETLKHLRESISISDTFQIQMLMNHLSKLSEMSTAIVTALNVATSQMVREIKN